MDTTRIIAIRHGETTWNADGRVQGHTDIGLSDTGRAQAQRLAQALAERDRLDAIYSSDLARARDTAAAVGAAMGVEVQLEPSLRERAFGRLEGSTFAGFRERSPEEAERWRRRDPEWQPAGGESLLFFQERIIKTVKGLAAKNMGKHMAVVAHGGVLDLLYRAATGLGLQDARTWQLANCAINRLLWTPDGLTLVGWADDHHLTSAAIDETTT